MIDLILSDKEIPLKYIIIVEKDTVFQRIISTHWFASEFEHHTLLITAKGYPDYATKQFVDNLRRDSRLYNT